MEDHDQERAETLGVAAGKHLQAVVKMAVSSWENPMCQGENLKKWSFIYNHLVNFCVSPSCQVW
jgi:hypothetical protein